MPSPTTFDILTLQPPKVLWSASLLGLSLCLIVVWPRSKGVPALSSPSAAKLDDKLGPEVASVGESKRDHEIERSVAPTASASVKALELILASRGVQLVNSKLTNSSYLDLQSSVVAALAAVEERRIQVGAAIPDHVEAVMREKEIQYALQLEALDAGDYCLVRSVPTDLMAFIGTRLPRVRIVTMDSRELVDGSFAQVLLVIDMSTLRGQELEKAILERKKLRATRNR